MSDEDSALVPTDAERAARGAELARQEAELLAEIARRRKRTKLIVVAVIAGAALVWLGVAVVRRVIARAEVEVELGKVRGLGEPVTMTDLEPPPVPDTDNAAPIFVRAYERYEVTEEKNGQPFQVWTCAVDDHRRFPKQTTQAQCARLLDKAMVAHTETLRLAHEAARRPALRFELKYADGEWMKKDSVGALRDAARLLAAEALWAAREDRPGDAVASLVAGMNTARLALKQQVPGDVLLPVWLWQKAIEPLRNACKETRFTDEMRRSLMQSLGDMDFARVAEGAMILARADMIEFARRSLDEPTEDYVGTVDANRDSGFLGIGLLRDEARCLRWMEEAVASTQLQPWRAWPTLRSIDQARQTVAVQEMRGAPITGEFPAVEFIYIKVLRAWARCDVARVGIALELCHSEKGEYPDSLNALAPEFLGEVPPDPYTGKPLRYVKEDKGFVVYSVGPNLSDDGGMPGTDRQALDIPWTGGERSSDDGAGR